MVYRCERCNRELITGMTITAAAGICPECGTPFAFPKIPLELNDAAVEEIARTLAIIAQNGGFGSLIVRFQRGSARLVGLGESLRDTWQGK